MRACAAILAQGIALCFLWLFPPALPRVAGGMSFPCPGLGVDTAGQLGWEGLEGAVPSGTHRVAGKGALGRGASSCWWLRACLAVGARGLCAAWPSSAGLLVARGGVWGALRCGGTLGRRLWAPTLAVGHRGLAILASDSGAQLTTGYRLSKVVNPLPLHLLLQWRALHDRSSFGRLWCLLCNDGDHGRRPLHMHCCHFGSRPLPCAL